MITISYLIPIFSIAMICIVKGMDQIVNGQVISQTRYVHTQKHLDHELTNKTKTIVQG